MYHTTNSKPISQKQVPVRTMSELPQSQTTSFATSVFHLFSLYVQFKIKQNISRSGGRVEAVCLTISRRAGDDSGMRSIFQLFNWRSGVTLKTAALLAAIMKTQSK